MVIVQQRASPAMGGIHFCLSSWSMLCEPEANALSGWLVGFHMKWSRHKRDSGICLALCDELLPIVKWIKLVLLGLLFSLCSCATVTDTLTSLPSLKPGKTYYYSGVANMKLYLAPNYDNPPSAKVGLNEKLILLKSKYRWAFVKVARTGRRGWVEKTYLERKPLRLKKSPEVKEDSQKGQSVKQAIVPESDENAKKGVVDSLGPKSAVAAPPPKEKDKPAEPQTDADVFDAF